MTQTTNIGLKKIDGSENWRQIFDYHNDSMDKADSSVAAVQDGLAIVANGNTHAAVAEGQFVYVRNHSTLAEGLYKATDAIATNGELTTSNLTADGSGGLNDLQGQVDALSSNINIITPKVDIPNTNINTGSFVTLTSVSVNTNGTFLIVADVAFPAGDGIRILLIDTTETDVNSPPNSVIATGRASLQKIRMFTLTPSDRVYIRAYQNSGAGQNVSGSYQILRLK